MNPQIIRLSKQLLFFFIASGIAVIADIAIYTSLVLADIYPGISNLISSTAAVTITYLLVTKRAFSAHASWKTYLIFIAWYALSISLFSILIQYLHSSLGLGELPAKIVSLPFSFTVNFTFSRYLFSRKWIYAPEK